MTLYILDTDIFSLHERRHPRVSPAVRACPPGSVAITVITVEEQLSGWYTLLRRAQQPVDLARAYERLADCVRFLATLPIVPFTEPAIARYDQLVGLRLNVGKNDLRIAAITLEQGGILVTRNRRDFQRVPGLVLEDWSV